MSEPNLNLLPMSTLDIVKRPNQFKRDVKFKQVVEYVVKDIKQNPKLNKQDNSVLIRICNLIENSIKKKDNINKFDLLVEIYRALFNDLQQVEIDVLKGNVQNLIDLKIIKKVSNKKIIYNYFADAFINYFF